MRGRRRGAERRSRDGVAAMAAARSPRHPRPVMLVGGRAAQAAVGSSLVAAHSAANTAGAFIPSAECGLRQL